MSEHKRIALNDTLSASIEKITKNFNKNWLVNMNRDGKFHSSNSNPGYYLSTVGTEDDSHGFSELCICIDGVFAIKIENTIYELKPGEVCIILPDIPHNELSAEKSEYTAIWFGFDLKTITIHLSGIKNKEFFTVDIQSYNIWFEYEYLLNNMIHEMKNKDLFFDGMLKLHVLNMLITTLRKMQSVSAQTATSPWNTSIVAEIQSFIENRGLKHLRLRDISQELCISAGHLNNIFKTITGNTIMQYVEDCRIKKAMYLLKNSTESINCISDELGYYDQYHFSKAFKKAVGYSPSQYRKD